MASDRPSLSAEGRGQLRMESRDRRVHLLLDHYLWAEARVAELEASQRISEPDYVRLKNRLRDLEAQAASREADARRMQERVRELEGDLSQVIGCFIEPLAFDACRPGGLEGCGGMACEAARFLATHRATPAPPPAPAAPVAQDAVHGERSTSAWARTLLDVPDAHEPGCPKRTFRVASGDAVRIEDRVCRCIVGRVAGVGVEADG